MTPPVAAAALFDGTGPSVYATYARILEVLGSISPVREVPKKTSIHLARTTSFAGIHPRNAYLYLTLRAGREASLVTPMVVDGQSARFATAPLSLATMRDSSRVRSSRSTAES